MAKAELGPRTTLAIIGIGVVGFISLMLYADAHFKQTDTTGSVQPGQSAEVFLPPESKPASPAVPATAAVREPPAPRPPEEDDPHCVTINSNSYSDYRYDPSKPTVRSASAAAMALGLTGEDSGVDLEFWNYFGTISAPQHETLTLQTKFGGLPVKVHNWDKFCLYDSSFNP